MVSSPCWCAEIEAGNADVLAAARRVGHYGDEETPKDAKELAGRLFYTVYMGTENRCAARQAAELSPRLTLLVGVVFVQRLAYSVGCTCQPFQDVVLPRNTACVLHRPDL